MASLSLLAGRTVVQLFYQFEETILSPENTLTTYSFNNNSKQTTLINVSSWFTTWNPKTDTMANSEDLDEVSHKATFHRGLHYLLRQHQRKKL